MTDAQPAVPKLDPPPERLTPYVETQVGRKNDLVARKTADEVDDLLPCLELWRDGFMVAVVMPDQIDRDRALQAASIAVPGFGADELYITLDSHYTNREINPLTGERWKQGEMQTACDNENACELGLITDTLWGIHITRDGTDEHVNLPYHVHKTARTVAWQDFQYHPPEHKLEGIVVDVLREVFAKGTMRQWVADQDKSNEMEEALAALYEDMDPDERQAHEDMGVTRALAGYGHVVMLHSHNETHARIVDESMKRLEAENNRAAAADILQQLLKGDATEAAALAKDLLR